MNNLAETNKFVFELEDILREYDQIDIEPEHHFAPGIYAREITIPADACIIGKMHRTEHLNIISQGRCTVFCLGERMEIEGPFTFVSYPGSKKAIYAHEDTVWTTVHATNETDLDALEREMIVSEHDIKELDNELD